MLLIALKQCVYHSIHPIPKRVLRMLLIALKRVSVVICNLFVRVLRMLLIALKLFLSAHSAIEPARIAHAINSVETSIA